MAVQLIIDYRETCLLYTSYCVICKCAKVCVICYVSIVSVISVASVVSVVNIGVIIGILLGINIYLMTRGKRLELQPTTGFNYI